VKSRKPVLFSDREAGKAGFSTFEILKSFFNCFFWSGLRKIFLVSLNVLLIHYYRLTANSFNIYSASLFL